MVSILINGSLTQEFRMERGLRQGDPLSLFLFLIVVEALQVLTLEECHSDMSGILINIEKSILYGIDIDPKEVESFSNILNYKNNVLPFVYLGLLGKDKTGKDVDLLLYRSMIGSLMYLMASRPDIMFDVCTFARHQVTPKECHLHAVKRIFRYLKGHPKLGIWYPKDSSFDLLAYSDSDYGGATQDWKSTTGGCQFLGRRLISWKCKRQTIMDTSTTEAKYIAAASGCGQVLWIQN
nr:uncharacterized mitochondrial protein AtMg00810-like [Tanacetum cinerariifolium]